MSVTTRWSTSVGNRRYALYIAFKAQVIPLRFGFMTKETREHQRQLAGKHTEDSFEVCKLILQCQGSFTRQRLCVLA